MNEQKKQYVCPWCGGEDACVRGFNPLMQKFNQIKP